MERRVVELHLGGATGREICKKLKTGDRKVRRILADAEAYGYLSGTPLPPVPLAIFAEPPPDVATSTSAVDAVLLAHKDWVAERLNLGWKRVSVWEELPITVARSSFYRFLSRHRLDRLGEKRARLIPEIVHKPAEALLVDWGKLRSVKEPDGKTRTLWAFVGVLGFSRYMMVRLVWTNDVATTILALESMLKELGGVPHRITSDNPKCFALEASKYEPLLNPVLERWSAHYGTLLECLPPADPQKKGKVERLMPFVRRLYEAHGEAWLGLEESQSYLDKKIIIANERKHGTTNLRPVEIFNQAERPALKALPGVVYEVEEFTEVTVRADGFVRFANKYYSVGMEYKGQEAVVLGTKTQVSIYLNGQLLEVHDRIHTPHVSKSTKPHHLPSHEQVMQDGAFYIKRGEKLGPFTAKLIAVILEQGQGFVDTRKVWGILSLDKTNTAEAIESACKLALEMNEPSYRRVVSLINLFKRETPAPTSAAAEPVQHKFVRDLNEYKQLLKEQKEIKDEPSNAN